MVVCKALRKRISRVSTSKKSIPDQDIPEYRGIMLPYVEKIPLELYLEKIIALTNTDKIACILKTAKGVLVYFTKVEIANCFIQNYGGVEIEGLFLDATLSDHFVCKRLIVWNLLPTISDVVVLRALQLARIKVCSALRYLEEDVADCCRVVYVLLEEDEIVQETLIISYGSGYHTIYLSEKIHYDKLDGDRIVPSCFSDSRRSSRCDKLIQNLEVEQLHSEMIFECLHLIGQDTSLGIKKDALLNYLKTVFQIEDAVHASSLSAAKAKEAPKVMLKVEVLEAKGLTPKDANGLSDPFCALWISSSQTDRFTTSVKMQTLHPVWEESFNLNVSSPNNDTLHLDVWDFDPAESFQEKMTRLNEVKTSFWGIKKYVKELTQTAYKGNHDNELIGSAQIILKNIPSTGQMAWFDLEKKNKGKQGMIFLKMMFGSEKDAVTALAEHRHLFRAILIQHLDQEGVDPKTWNGCICNEAQIILRQHLAHSNLGNMEDLLTKWVEYVNLHRNRHLNIILIANVLNELVQYLRTGSLVQNEEKIFWDTAKKILPSCFNFIRRINKCTRKENVEKLTAVVSIMKNLSSCETPANVNLFSLDVYGWLTSHENLTINHVIHEAVINGANDWFDYLMKRHKVINNVSDANTLLQERIKLVEFIDIDLEHSLQFNEPIFNSLMQFPYTRTLFAIYQRKVSDMVKTVVIDLCMTMRPLDFEKQNEANDDPVSMGTSMFELYRKLQKLNQIGANLHGDDYETESFEISLYYDWFFAGVARWLDIAAYKAMQRIEKAVELDEFISVDGAVQYSSSAVDTMSIYFQIKIFWDQLEWPSVEGSYTFIARIIDDICKCSVFYADKIGAKVDNMGQVVTENGVRYRVTDEWCIAINNIDYVHRCIHPFVSQLGVDKVLSSLADFKTEMTAQHCRETLELVMNNTIENVGNKIADLLYTVATKMLPSMTAFLAEGAELLHQQGDVLDRLMQYLDDNLIKLKSKLNSDNFSRIVDIIWDTLSEVLYNMVHSGIEKHKPPSFFSNLHKTMHTLIGFFHEDNEEKVNEKLVSVEKILQFYGMETPDLIHSYYCERYKEQQAIEQSSDGKIAVQMSQENDLLHIEILNAQNIRPMDSNGYCDPFVSIRLLPEHKFPNSKHKTKVHKKTLYPLFEEKFTFKLTAEQQKVQNTIVMFVIKDQDYYGAKNDYMAESFLPISDGLSTNGKQLHLHLHRPTNLESEILKALDYRQQDKVAKDFVKRQKTRSAIPHP